MKRVGLLTILLAIFMGLQLASAGNLDKYREMLNNRSCTIKYEFIYQDERQNYTDDMDLQVMKLNEKYSANMKKNFQGVIVLKGDASYIEMGEYSRELSIDTEELARSLSGKGAVTDVYIQPEGHHCEADWEKQNDRYMNFLWCA